MKRRARKRTWLRRLMGLGGLLLCAAVAACIVGEREPEPIDITRRPDNLPVQAGWRTPAANPVLPAGSLRPQALWNDPTVLKEDGRYIMYMTSSIERPFKPPVVPFRAVSSDGIAWRLDPATPVAMPTGTSFVSVETPSVVKFRGEYHMFFTGILPDGSATLMAIGHAVSADGVSWRVAPAPVIAATGHVEEWNGVLVGEPGAIVRGDEIFVYFSAVAARKGGRPAQDQSIGLATTRDGEHFTPQRKVLSQGPAYPAEKGFAGYSAPSAFELDGKVHLVYDVVLSLKTEKPEWQQVALQHAVSTTDGTGSFVEDAEPIYTRNSFPWTYGEVIGPTALVDDGRVKLWFGGHVPVSHLGPLIRRGFVGNEFGINYASRSIGEFRR